MQSNIGTNEAPEIALSECPHCGEKIRADAIKCKYCKEFVRNPEISSTIADGDERVTTNIPPKKFDPFNTPISGKPFFITLSVLACLIAGFLLFFHTVSYSGGFTIVPKEHATFSESFVTLDDLISQYNNRSFGEKLRGEGVNSYLVKRLEEKGLIKDAPSSETANTSPSIFNESVENEPDGEPIDDLSFLLQFQGKYPHDINFFEIPLIKSRLSNLLTTNLDIFKERFEVQSPIQTNSSELFASACMPHFCTVHDAAFSIDLHRNILFVGISIDGNKRLYSENNDSNYPEMILNWYNSD